MRVLRICVAILAICVARPAFAAFTKLIVFGDSLSDVGNVHDQTFGFAPPSTYFDGRYSNGPLWVEQLAQALNLAVPTPSRDGGSDYAFAGTRTGGGSTFFFPFSFPNAGTQINTYLGQHAPAASELFTVWAGGNDFIDGNQTNPSIPVNNLVNHVTALANAGAKNIVVPNLPELGNVPRFRGTANESVMNARTQQFNAQLAAAMDGLDASLAADVNIFQFDVAGFFTEALANPASFGLTNVTSPALVGSTPAPNQDEYLFWDDIHPTRVGHQFLADRAARLVSTHTWASAASGGNWSDASNWNPAGAPASDWIAQVFNVQPDLSQAVSVQANSTVQSILVAGQSRQMTLIVQAPATLTATSDVQVDPLGRVDLFGGTLATPVVNIATGGALGGSGTVQGKVNNAGVVSPGDPGTLLNIDGDYEQQSAGELVIELADVSASDRLNVSGVAALAGALRVRLVDGFVAYPGLTYEVLTFDSHSGDVSIINDTGFAGLGFAKSFAAMALSLTTTGTGGDANLDGIVNLADFNILATNFGTGGHTWLAADFTGDGMVNLSDFNILAGNFGLSAGPGGPTAQDWSALAAVVPEPASGLILLPIFAVAASRRHLRKSL